MRCTPIIFAGLVAAAPSMSRRDGTVSMMAAGAPEWTIENMLRVCTTDDKTCNWSFGVNNSVDAVAECAFSVSAGDKPASETDFSGVVCGQYTVSGGWSDQFGADNGFTTLSVADFASRQIVYPAYTDKELAAGTVVSPNKSYAPQMF